MRTKKIYNPNDEFGYPDDHKLAREATAVVIFCIIGGPTILVMIMCIAMYHQEIKQFTNYVGMFMYHNPIPSISVLISSMATILYFKFWK